MARHEPEPESEAAAAHYNVPTYYRAINNDDRAAFRGLTLRVGQKAPTFQLPGLDGSEIALPELLTKGHVGLVFGSYSAPPTILGMPAIDELNSRLPDAATIVFVYTREIHPNQQMLPTHQMLLPHHQSLELKMEAARRMRDDLGLRLPICVDNIAGTIHRAYGNLPFSAVVIKSNGTLVHRQEWADADLLGAVLENLLLGDQRAMDGAPGRSSYTETIWNSKRGSH